MSVDLNLDHFILLNLKLHIAVTPAQEAFAPSLIFLRFLFVFESGVKQTNRQNM